MYSSTKLNIPQLRPELANLQSRSAPDIHSLRRPPTTQNRLHALRRLPSWKKLLYLKQPYPDNYTDRSFLSQLKRNTTVAKYSYVKLVSDFSLIVFHLSSLLLVILMFTAIYQHHWNCVIPAAISSLATLGGFAMMAWMESNSKLQKGANAGNFNLKSHMLIIFILLLLSPILKSLTRSTSSDSIWALSFVMCLASTIFHNYGMNTNPTTPNTTAAANVEYRPILSTNISLSNSIILASRLATTSQVFFFILFSMQSNLLLPLFDYNIRKHQFKYLHRFIFVSLIQIVNYLIWSLLGVKILVFWGACVIGIMFGMPLYFLFLQRYKNELQGPWDVAKPRINKVD